MEHPVEHNANLNLSRRKFIRDTALTGAGFAFVSPKLPVAGTLADHYANASADSIVADKLRYSDHVTMNGYIGKKLDLSYH